MPHSASSQLCPSVEPVRAAGSLHPATRLAAAALGAPIAFVVTRLLEDPTTVSAVGLGDRQLANAASFAAQALAADDDVYVADVLADVRFAHHRLVRSSGVARFFAGVRFSLPGGAVGAVCVLGPHAPPAAASGTAALRDAAAVVEQQVAADDLATRYSMLKDALPVGVFETDPAGSCTYTNPAWNDMTGLTSEDALGDGWSAAIHHDDKAAVFRAWHEAAESGVRFRRTFRFWGPTLGTRWVQVGALPVRDAGGRTTGWIGFNEDITGFRNVEHTLHESEERFRQLAEASEEVFWITDVKTHDVLYVSPAYEKIWGRTVESIVANPWDWIEAIHPDDRERAQAAFGEVLGGASKFEVEFRIVRPDGTVRYVLDRGFPVYDENGELVRMAGVASDITELHSAREQLRHRAETDSLTGTLNAGTVREMVKRELHRSKRSNGVVALAIIDVDEFKQVNDVHGHAVGDKTLTLVAQQLRDRLRESDIIGRLGGDEFCVVLPDCDIDSAERVLDELVRKVAATPVTTTTGHDVPITLSVGVAATRAGALADDELFLQADAALYVAKRRGRNQVCRAGASSIV